ncbi:MAG: response regulator [Candidatus Omnitrophota bacterium]|nr:response regulator [Candidatus Omnitrophota bacterium]MBU1929371.1 response regulator [Candidatus Omnitrophota bacterium]MBU2035258.1 response regulator [Candidatus Omnitrophota bacterium]MBU2221843.1 response regulator [Candidatus Omnitrophota bacterium]MBU2257998.1 response regulator [Candidatus Omnitrophota bacterium]
MGKILIVDDEPVIIKILNRCLKLKGYEVISLLGGGVMDIITSSDCGIDLIIMDIKMPGVNGLDIIREMRAKKINIPVIILTGSIDREKHYNEFKELGFDYDDIFQKPADLYVLLDKIKSKLSQRPPV